MKNWIFFSAFFAISSVCLGQVNEYGYGNPMIPIYYNYNMNKPNETAAIITKTKGDKKLWEKFVCDGGKCKPGIYNKIEFVDDLGNKYYTKGEVYYKKSYSNSSKSYMFNGPMSIYYAETGTLAFEGVYTDYGTVSTEFDNHIYYRKNGTKFLEFLNAVEDGKKIHRKIVYDTDGSILSDLEYDSDYKYKESPKYPSLGTVKNGSSSYPFHFDPIKIWSGTKEESWPFVDQIAINSYLPSVLDHSDKGSYAGFSHLGVYNVPDGNHISGFLLPTVEEYGNGSVVYVTNETTNESYYTIYFDGTLDLDFKVSTPKMVPLEFVQKLNEETDYEHFHPITVKFPTVINMKTKNLQTHTGYGINYSTEVPLESKMQFIRTMEIGFFKNGKLDGLGYKLKMHSISSPYYASAFIGYNVDYEYGFFENGVLKKGKSHKAEGEIWTDIWHPVKVKGIEFAYRAQHLEKYPINSKSINFSTLSLAKPLDVYIGSVHKWAQVLEIDKANKTLKVKTYQKNELATVGKNDQLFVSTITSDAYTEQTCKNCRGSKTVLNTYNKTEYVYRSSVQKGLYYNYYRSYSYPVTKKVSEVLTCGTCEGTGKKVYKNLDIKYLFTPIAFE